MSVESVASRTRHRKKAVLDSVPELETIAEKEVKEELKEEVKEEVKEELVEEVKEEVVTEVAKSVKKKQTGRKSGIPIAKGSKSKKAKIETVVEEVVAKTPAPKEKSTTKKKARKLSLSEVVEDTPQIKVTRTRSRKLNV